MKIRNILATKGSRVLTARPEQTLHDATRMLTQNRIGALVITDSDGKVVGILSERDIIHAIAAREDALGQPISQVMTRQVITGTPSDDVQAVMQTMTNGRFRHIPVLDQGKLCGLISIGDIVKNLLENYEGEIATLQTQISGSED